MTLHVPRGRPLGANTPKKIGSIVAGMVAGVDSTQKRVYGLLYSAEYRRGGR